MPKPTAPRAARPVPAPVREAADEGLVLRLRPDDLPVLDRLLRDALVRADAQWHLVDQVRDMVVKESRKRKGLA